MELRAAMIDNEQGMENRDKTVAELWQEIADKAIHLAYYYTMDWDEAQDMVQTAFLKALKKMDSFQQGKNFSAWYFKILVNTCRDWKRSAYRRLRQFVKDIRWLEPKGKDAAPMWEENQMIRDLIKQLTDRQRLVFVLRYLEDFSVSEIAELLDISPDTVRVLSMQARRRLREIYQREYL